MIRFVKPIGVVAAAAVLATVLAVTPAAVAAGPTTVTTFDELEAAVTAATEPSVPTQIVLSGDLVADATLNISGNVVLEADHPVTVDLETSTVEVASGAALTIGENVTISQPEAGTGHPVRVLDSTHLTVKGHILSAATGGSIYTVDAVGAGIRVDVIGGEVTTVNGRALYTNDAANIWTLDDATITATGSGTATYRGWYIVRGDTAITGPVGGGAQYYDFRGYQVDASPAHGAFQSGELVALAGSGSSADNAADAQLFYTTDGSDPVDSATAKPYTEPFPIAVGTTVTAAFVKDGYRGHAETFVYDRDNDTASGALASVQSFVPLTVPVGTPLDEIPLPELATATLTDARTKVLAIDWDDAAVDTTKEGAVTLTGALVLTPSLSNPQNIAASIVLHVGESAISEFAFAPEPILTAGKSNTRAGTAVGSFTAEGGDSVSYVYTLTGGADDASFTIDGGRLVAAQDLAGRDYTVEVKATSGRQELTQTFTIAVAPEGEPFVIADPYEGVNWATAQQLKTSLHNHTDHSHIEWPDEGATGTVPSRIAVYQGLGYGAVAITDHDFVSYPWEDWGLTGSPLIAIPGNEVSKNAHILSYFSTYLDSPGQGPDHTVGMDQNIQNAGALGGFLYIAHPSRSGGPTENPDYTQSLLEEYPQVRGFEVLNAGQFANNHSEELWDDLLTKMMPERPIYGTSSDDSHSDSMSTIGTGWTNILAAEKDQSSVRDALFNGQTYFSTYRVDPATDDNKPDPGVPAPRIDNIDVTGSTITIAATDAAKIQWISAGGEVVATGPSVDVNDVAGVSKYIRARLYGEGMQTQTQTQPFGLFEQSTEDTSDPVITLSTEPAATVEPGDELDVPEASAMDDQSGALAVPSTIITPAGDRVLAIDNRYTPAEQGAYTIEYAATDAAGNRSVVTRAVTVSDEPGDGEPGDGEPGDGEPGDGDPGDDNPGDDNPSIPAAPSESDLTDANRGNVSAPDSVQLGQPFTLGVGEEHAGEPVRVFAFSEPKLIGAFTVTESGSLRIALPADLAVGKHRIAVQAESGTIVGWTEITVTAAAPAGGGGSSVGNDSAGSGSEDPQGSLASTGQEFPGAVMITTVLLLALGGLLLWRSRRRAARN